MGGAITSEEINKEFQDIDWMRGILNEYTVNAIQRMINTITAEERFEHILKNKAFVQCPVCGESYQKTELIIK